MKRPGITPSEIIICLLIIGVVALIPYSMMRPSLHRSWCQDNLHQVALGVQQYTVDWNKRFPPVAINRSELTRADSRYAFGWADVIQPYLKAPTLLQCPTEEHAVVEQPWEPGYTDYFFNSRLDHISVSSMMDPGTTYLLGDGTDDFQLTTGRYARWRTPTSWLTQVDSPALVHGEGTNFTFFDGHVRWVRKRALACCDDGCSGACYHYAP